MLDPSSGNPTLRTSESLGIYPAGSRQHMAIGELWEKFRDQEMVDFRLVLAIPVVLVIGAIVYFVFVADSGGVSGDRDSPALGEHAYYCHFDQTQVNASGERLWELDGKGDAIVGRDSGIPSRIRCPKCDRMSCFRHDADGNPIEIDEGWDLSATASYQGRQGGGSRSR